MMSVDEILGHNRAKSMSESESSLLSKMRYEGFNAKDRCFYIPERVPSEGDRRAMGVLKRHFPRYKPYIGFFSAFPPKSKEVPSIRISLDGMFERNGVYWFPNKSLIQQMITKIRTAQMTDEERNSGYAGNFKDRITIKVTLDGSFEIKSNSDFGDLTNIKFIEVGTHRSIEWVQRNFDGDTVEKFFGKKGAVATLVGTVSGTYTRFGRSHTRMKRCELYNARGQSIRDWYDRRSALALRKEIRAEVADALSTQEQKEKEIIGEG